MKFNKDIIYSENSFFWLPTYYDKQNDIYFCEPENKEFVSKFYEKEYWDKFSRNKNKINWKWKMINFIFNILNINELIYLYDLKILEKYKKINKNSFLEIWVWFWKNIKYLYRKKYNVKWLEIDKENSKNINNELKKEIIINWNYEELIIEEKFDIIYLRHVLEHFFDINEVIKKFKNNINKNWIIYINIPNANNEYILNQSINNHPHIYHFTKKSIKNIFEEKWFKTLHLWTYDFNKKNKILYILKSFLWIWDFNKNIEDKWEFLIWVFINK